MPELPEIEHLAALLRPQLVGRSIVGVRCRQPKLLNLPLEEYSSRVRGRVVAVERRGKHCVLRLESGSVWLHLGLGGFVAVGPRPDAEPHLGLALDDGRELTVDKVFMGRAYYYPEAEFAARWAELSPEPLADEFTLPVLQGILRRKVRQSLKALLMDQKLIAGIGNYYSDEILHAARLHPARLAGSLAEAEAIRLHAAMKAVLSEAVAAGGEADFVDIHGRGGGYRPRVHGRETCLDCGGPVQRESLGGRTAYFCPSCQSPP
ncbi:MAG: Fpg/Nei family DNA glycosylase [Chloroflexota bacterium]